VESWLPPQLPDRTGELWARDDSAGTAIGAAAVCDISLDELESGQLALLNRTLILGKDETDWRLGAQTRDRLQAVTLHFHEWLYALAHRVAQQGPDAARADRLLRWYLADWIARCGLQARGSRELAWNSYAIATRIGWWVRLYAILGPEKRASWGGLERAFLESLWQQAAYLRRHLEYDLRANHLLRDAVGLAWAGRFFAGDEAAEWLQTASELAQEQIAEQVLPDGCHFERSPMYHVTVMQDVLTLATLLGDVATLARLRETWTRMAECLSWLCHPDGQIALLNDAAHNGAAPPAETLARGAAHGLSVPDEAVKGARVFKDTGLAVWHSPTWMCVFDIGPLGPDYQPGHGHADHLTIEASFKGQRLIVDPGTWGYDDDDRRRYDRSTPAHNTVCVAGEDSSEMWSIFRVGRRGKPIPPESVETAGRLAVRAASHTGYEHLPGAPRHTRALDAGEDALVIQDRIEGSVVMPVAGGFLLAPGWRAEAAPHGWRLSKDALAVAVRFASERALQLGIETAAYHPEFGKEVQTSRLVWRYKGEFPLNASCTFEPA
jgi:uncharacterized heparinase superfamily protein